MCFGVKMKSLFLKFDKWCCKASLFARLTPYIFSLIGFAIWLVSPGFIGSVSGGVFFGLFLALLIMLQHKVGVIYRVLSPLMIFVSIGLGVFLNSWKEEYYSQAVFSSNQETVTIFTAVLMAMVYLYLLSPNNLKRKNKGEHVNK